MDQKIIGLKESAIPSRLLQKLVNKRLPVCGFFSELNTPEFQSPSFHNRSDAEIKSMAVMPLFIDKNNCFGALILGSEDAKHFSSENGYLFLQNLAEIISLFVLKFLK